jgi:DNA-binding transcriptional LysR family regulator
MDKLKAMQYLCQIVQTGSFSAAARLAGVPVSSLSRSLKALESELGAELLKRSTRHVATTEIGSIYVEQCQDILNAVGRAESQVGSYQSHPSGVLRISALPLYAQIRLMPILEALQDAYPDIVIDLDLSNRVSDLSRDGVDIAIRGGGIPTGRIVAQYIDDNTHFLCASPGYLEQHGTPRRLEDLAAHKCLLYRAPGRVMHWQVEHGGSWLPVAIQTSMISNDGSLLRQAMVAGKGLGLFPRWCMEAELLRGDLVLVPFDRTLATTADPTMGVYLLYQRPAYVIPKIKVAVDMLRSHLLCGQQSV